MTDMFPAESIYNLIPREEVKVPKQPRHTSKFRETVKEETQRHKAPNKTMGPVKVDVPSPEKVLQKHSKEPKLANNTEGGLLETPLKKMCDDQKKPQVPLRTDHPVMGIQTKKNFIKTNAVETIMSVPKNPQPNYGDTRREDKQLLDTSGLVPKFTNKKDYGQTPEYLIKQNKEVQRAQEEYDAYIKERILQGKMKQLSDEETDAVLQGLKKNWGELHHQYQGISVVTDTTPKKYRKERLETEMKQLEKDIDMIERHKTIYIANR